MLVISLLIPHRVQVGDPAQQLYITCDLLCYKLLICPMPIHPLYTMVEICSKCNHFALCNLKKPHLLKELFA